MTLSTWLTFCAIEFVLCLSPGPSVLLVSSLSLTGSRKSAIIATCGVLMANAIYFLIAALGLSVILNLSINAFYVLKWVGAAYLAWIGANIIWKSFTETASEPVKVSPIKALGQGFVTQAANPNLIFYFSAILPQFIDPSVETSPQIFILGVSSLLVEAMVLLMYGYAGIFVYRTGSPAARKWINRAGGGMLITAAVVLGSVKNVQNNA